MPIRIYYKPTLGTTDADYALYREYSNIVAGEKATILVDGLLNFTSYTFSIRNVVGGTEGASVVVSATTLDGTTLRFVLKGTFAVADQTVTSGFMGTGKGVEIGGLEASVSDGTLSISSGRLYFTAQSTPLWGGQFLFSGTAERLTEYGDFLRFGIAKTSGSTTKLIVGAGHYRPLVDGNQTNFRPLGIELHASGNLFLDVENQARLIGTYTIGSYYQVAIVAGGYDKQGNIYTGGDNRNFTGGLRLFMKGGTEYPEWTMLMKDFNMRQSATVLGTNELTQWIDFSDGTNTTTTLNGALRLLDNNPTVENQTKVLTKQFTFAPKMEVTIGVTLLQLNSSANMDDLTAGTPGFGETNRTNDDSINKSGLSFAILHPSLPIRVIFAVVKAQDYATSGNIEIWSVENSPRPVTGSELPYVIFRRQYSGNVIPIGTYFELDCDYNLISDTQYEVSISVAGQKLINKIPMGMVSTYGGQGSMLFQCKGTDTEPCEYTVHIMRVNGIGANFSFLNFDSAGYLDDLSIRNQGTAAVVLTSHLDQVSTGSNIVHDTNGVFEFHIDKLPTSGDMTVAFRYQDATNYYRIAVGGTGNLLLNLMNNGTLSAVLINGSNAVIAGTKVYARISGTRVQLWAADKLIGTYTGLTSFATATTAQVLNLGGGIIRNMASQPLISQAIIDTLNA